MRDELVVDLQGELDIGDAESTENRGRGGFLGKTSTGDSREIVPPVCQARHASFWATFNRRRTGGALVTQISNSTPISMICAPGILK